MRIGTIRETAPGERRVALTPGVVGPLKKLGAEVVVERGAGAEAGFTDDSYAHAGAALASRDEVFAQADLVCQVRALGANPHRGEEDLPRLRAGQAIVGLCDPLGSPDAAAKLAATGATVFALELLPRITRAQSMDVLSSQATVAGYKAVLLAAMNLPRFLPMFMTAAGTIAAARTMVIGAGVAGLQAIATARRNGAVVSAYDVRAAVKEQIESLGAKFIDLGLDTRGAEAAGGYAKALDESFYERQREALARVAAEQDAIVTTAAIPGRKSPLLITRAAVEGMRPGSVIVDLAAERGGNCELSRPDEEVVHHGVRILGPTNLPATVPQDASQMFARNLVAFLTPMLKGAEGGALRIDLGDEVIAATLLARDGKLARA
ncbi:MAG: Re/Si-specific NAD(P)(+) transhydrogenase subunit alpha [Phycisphaerales bacterium]